MNFIVIPLEDEKWSETLEKCCLYDFYHTSCYNQLELREGIPKLILAESDEQLVAMPIIVREILGTNWKDVTSAYGYCGIISDTVFGNVKSELKDFFWSKLLEYFNDIQVITAFSRLHPLIDTYSFFDQVGRVRDLNQTVSIDLTISPEEQKRQFRKSTKSEINQLKRKGFEVFESNNPEDVDEFIETYWENMKRVGASNYYLFSKEYFKEFLTSDCFTTKLLVAKVGNELAAGAIFTITGRIMQYHLAATREEYTRLAPMKLILDEARNIGYSRKLEFLHLGGGVGGSDEDSLFKFKSGFSKQRHRFRVWQWIINQVAYNELTSSIETVDNGYFPLYRASKRE